MTVTHWSGNRRVAGALPVCGFGAGSCAKGAAAELRRLDVARGEAQRDLDRAKELHERTVISATDPEQAKIDFAAAEAAAEAAQAALTRARLELCSTARSALPSTPWWWT